jgi:hypothetical protein
MPAPDEKTGDASATSPQPRPKKLSIAKRNLMMVAVGLAVFAAVSGIVLYGPIMYGDMIPNFGIILMLTVPVIAGVAFRVGLDAWLDKN